MRASPGLVCQCQRRGLVESIYRRSSSRISPSSILHCGRRVQKRTNASYDMPVGRPRVQEDADGKNDLDRWKRRNSPALVYCISPRGIVFMIKEHERVVLTTALRVRVLKQETLEPLSTSTKMARLTKLRS